MPFIVTDVCQFAIIVWSLLCVLYNICFVLYAFCLVLFAFLFGCSIAIVRLVLAAFARHVNPGLPLMFPFCAGRVVATPIIERQYVTHQWDPPMPWHPQLYPAPKW